MAMLILLSHVQHLKMGTSAQRLRSEPSLRWANRTSEHTATRGQRVCSLTACGRGSSSWKQRLVKSEQARVAEEGQMERGLQDRRAAVGSQLQPPSARNNKQAFSYSNKYQASGVHGRAADKETRVRSHTGGWLLCYTGAYLGSRAGPRRAKQAVTDL